MSDRYDDFITAVEQEGDLPRGEAEAAARATLETLAERLSPGEAEDLAEQLPEEVRPWLASDSPAQAFGLSEFLRLVADREGGDIETAERHARAVFVAMARTARDPSELDDVASELPNDFEPLLAAARPRGQKRFARPVRQVMSYDRFITELQDRSGLDRSAAERTAEAALETLAERISGGEVEDLMDALAPELQPALRRGNDRSHGAARKMSLEEFLEEVAERENSTPDEAVVHVQAVLDTLRDAVSGKEFDDLKAQLPDDYTRLIPAR